MTSALPGIACNELLGIQEYQGVSADDGDGTTGMGGNGIGGTAGVAGSSGTGAGGGTGGAADSHCGFTFEPGDFRFDSGSTEGFVVTYGDPDSLKDASTVEAVSGVLRITVPFEPGAQEIYVAASLDPPRNLTGKLITACLRATGGPSPSTVELFAETTVNQEQGFSELARLVVGEWLALPLDADYPVHADGPYDPTDMRSIGFFVTNSRTHAITSVIEVGAITIRER